MIGYEEEGRGALCWIGGALQSSRSSHTIYSQNKHTIYSQNKHKSFLQETHAIYLQNKHTIFPQINTKYVHR